MLRQAPLGVELGAAEDEFGQLQIGAQLIEVVQIGVVQGQGAHQGEHELFLGNAAGDLLDLDLAANCLGQLGMLGHLHRQPQADHRRNSRRRRLKACTANPVIFRNRFHLSRVLLFRHKTRNHILFGKKCYKF